ncbi:uncharacterized protein TRIADDRAFT_50705 [Trichoplax adhaerens]|uniref:Coiled-coil domain-containing protein 25 n=1 Tax=Trichoplax adhaerens TaxID=10228 RepID=B3S4V4_TRIAD|nr:hypothetical protein TRIADDRAFT_50705 [Trichoplax adhaerens]EDV22154.1 hypothetical protein TRIADDRAFT_50705 [Trichoplax adhaerens]|eukprot:XP_002115309.1 hypothetical protein TRIADDRAFT_50705 [Trichoplax adhaerens]
MVFYYQSTAIDPSCTIYVGRDKYENEELLKYAFAEDVWFHVDKLSSAHVYLRMPKDMSIDSIPTALLHDCAQLVKANSIQGCKLNNVKVVYTPASNIKKTADMEVGQVGFHKSKEVRLTTVDKKDNAIINRLNKTKLEKYPDLAGELLQREKEEREERKQLLKEQSKIQKEEILKRQQEQEIRSYSSLMKTENMTTNAEAEDDDDFM